MSLATPRILSIDIECAPNLGHIWSLWKQNVSLKQLQESAYILSFAAKWTDQRKIVFYSDWDHGQEGMLTAAWNLLDEADWVVHYNGRRFDIPWFNGMFLNHPDISRPYSPIKQIDLLETVKKNFRFPSNKLDYVSQTLGIGKKLEHEGHQLWVDVMAGDKKAQKRMEKYNKQDVKLTEDLYNRLLPWVSRHPNMGLYVESDNPVCPHCGGTHLQKRGFSCTGVSKFQRWACQDCGAWSRGRSNVMTKEQRENVLSAATQEQHV